MATQLEQVQSVLNTIITGCPLCVSDADRANVFVDNGTQNDEMEKALKKGGGWCVLIGLPIGASMKDQFSAGPTSSANSGRAMLTTLVVITLRTNPKVNKGGNAKNLFVGVRQIIKAVLSWTPSAGSERGFTLHPDLPFEPDYTDVGCETYDIRVNKTVPI